MTVTLEEVRQKLAPSLHPLNDRLASIEAALLLILDYLEGEPEDAEPEDAEPDKVAEAPDSDSSTA